MGADKTAVRTTVRLPQELHARIAKLAEAERRSFNAQVIVMLAEAAKRARLKDQS